MQSAEPGPASGFGRTRFQASLDKGEPNFHASHLERSLASNISHNSFSSQFAPSTPSYDAAAQSELGYIAGEGHSDQGCLGYWCCLPLKGIKAVLEGCVVCIERVTKSREAHSSLLEQKAKGSYSKVQAPQFEL